MAPGSRRSMTSPLARSHAKPQASFIYSLHTLYHDSLHFTHHAEPDQPVRLRGLQTKTIRCAASSGLVVPAAAADDAEELVEAGVHDALGRSLWVFLGTRLVVIRVVPVRAPLGHVAVHVKEAPRVRSVGADWRRLLQERPLGGFA